MTTSDGTGAYAVASANMQPIYTYDASLNADSTLKQSSAGLLGINLANSNTWTVAQTFSTISLTGTSPSISTYNNIATAGTGVPFIVASAVTGSISSTQSNLINYTTPAAVGVYRLSIAVSTTSGTNTGTLTPSVTFKSQGGQTAWAPNFMQTGSATLLTATTAASKNFSSVSVFSVDNSQTAITLTMTVSGTVAAYITATLEQLA